VALAWAVRRPGARARALGVLARLPGVQDRARIYRLSRLYRTIGLLLLSGIALSKAMQMARDTVAAGERPALDRARRALEEGHPLSEALRVEHLSTTIADSLMRVGEQSGRLGDMLDRAAQFHEDEFARWIDAATRLVEPLLMVAIGLVIGAIVVLMYLPIFELAGSLG
jgi:general secretion pathway protein F